MTKRIIHAGTTAVEDGSLQQSDTLDIRGGASGDGPGGTAIVDIALMNAGKIVVFGGFAASQSGQAGGQGGLLDVAGVLTDQGSIVIHGGHYERTSNVQDLIDITDIPSGAGLALSYTQNGGDGSLVVSNGSISSTITLQGQFTTSSFTTATDMHGGVLISLHG